MLGAPSSGKHLACVIHSSFTAYIFSKNPTLCQVLARPRGVHRLVERQPRSGPGVAGGPSVGAHELSRLWSRGWVRWQYWSRVSHTLPLRPQPGEVQTMPSRCSAKKEERGHGSLPLLCYHWDWKGTVNLEGTERWGQGKQAVQTEVYRGEERALSSAPPSKKWERSLIDPLPTVRLKWPGREDYNIPDPLNSILFSEPWFCR